MRTPWTFILLVLGALAAVIGALGLAVSVTNAQTGAAVLNSLAMLVVGSAATGLALAIESRQARKQR